MPKDRTGRPPAAPRQSEVTSTAESSEQAKPAEEVRCGIATDIWITLEAYPEEMRQCLFLRVDEGWRYWYGQDLVVWLSVQSAFCNCSESLEVVVWYNNDDYIVGLVVRSKYSLTTECYREPEKHEKHAGNMFHRRRKDAEATTE